MKRKSLKKAGFAAVLTLAVLSAMPAAAFAAVESEPAATAVEPRADEIGYKYRLLDGKLQRRLWNYTDGCWIGDWEYC